MSSVPKGLSEFLHRYIPEIEQEMFSFLPVQEPEAYMYGPMRDYPDAIMMFAAGFGTRMKHLTQTQPKPMVPVGNRPILWHIMKTYAHHGHKDFILCLGYKAEIIREYFCNYLWYTSDITIKLGRSPQAEFHMHHDEEDWSVTLLDTGEDTQTGGRLQRALEHVKGDDFLFTYGDGLTDSDITASVE